jgi:hypothetical protein
VASAHLAHTLAQKTNEYGSGISAFKQGYVNMPAYRLLRFSYS